MNPIRRRRLVGNPYPLLAAHFTAASTQYFSIADNASLSMGTGVRMSIAGWAWFDTLGVQRHLVAKGFVGGTAGQLEYGLVKPTGNTLLFRVSDGATLTTVQTTATFAASTWSFFFASYDGSNINASINNAPVTAVVNSLDIQDAANAFAIGGGGGGQTPQDGRIDAVGVWKRALSVAEVTQLYNNGVGMAYRDLGGLAVGLAGWWNFDGNGNDSQGANNLTNNNGCTFVAGKR